VDEAVMRDRISRSIQDAGRPVLGFGVVGPPECCIITGLDRAGEVLMGWSFFQDAEDFSPGLDFEPCGYFRKRGWFADTQALILLGERTGPVSSEEVYRRSLQRAIDLIRRPTLDLDGPWPSGLAAFTAWAETIVRNQDLPAGDLACLRQRHLAHSSTVGTVAEGRWYGSLFLKAAAEAIPDLADPLKQAAACFEQEHTLMWQIWGLACGLGFDDEKVRRFAEPSVREQIAPLLCQARDLDHQAADHLEEALGMGPGNSS
jgi:hypothetical protein